MVKIKNVEYNIDSDDGYQDINLEDGRTIREYFKWDIAGFGDHADRVYVDFGDVDIYDSEDNLIEREYNDEELELIETYCGDEDDSLRQEIEESEAYKELYPDIVKRRGRERWEDMMRELEDEKRHF